MSDGGGTPYSADEGHFSPDQLERVRRLAREQVEWERKRKNVCRCGHPKAECRPEICSHEFARDAMWGDS